jgi:hypothetical protein
MTNLELMSDDALESMLTASACTQIWTIVQTSSDPCV